MANAQAIKDDVFRFIKNNNESFDIVFADPPYDLDGIKKLPSLILQGSVLKPGGLFILEHSGDYNFENEPAFTRTRKYSNVHFSFFEKPAN